MYGGVAISVSCLYQRVYAEMKCKDCIHFTDEIINDKYYLCDAYKTIGGIDKQDAWAVSSNDGGCKLFEVKDNSWESVSK